MEQKITLDVFCDDNPYELVDRLRFVLIELGIKMTIEEEIATGEHRLYSFSHAEKLDG
mgnify:CR=1 FL=1